MYDCVQVHVFLCVSADPYVYPCKRFMIILATTFEVLDQTRCITCFRFTPLGMIKI